MIKIYNQFYTDYIEEKATNALGNRSVLELCERQANGFCSLFRRTFGDNHRILVFAGPGRNGAIALAVARILHSMGLGVEALVLNPTGLLSDECQANMRQLMEVKCSVREVTTSFNPPLIKPEDIVIDGICGIELNVPFAGDLALVAQYINKKKSLVVSIDIPSGLMCEDNRNNNMDSVIQATHTFTFNGPKYPFFFKEYAPYVGKWQIIDVALDEPDANNMVKRYLFSLSDVYGLILHRQKFSHKYDYGRIALIAGSKGMVGAAALAGKAAMRAGAGHLTIHVPQGYAPTIHTYLPEALVDEDLDSSCFSMFSNAERYDAIGIGPGLGRHFTSAKALENLLSYYNKPMVIDADAIHLLAANKSLLERIPQDSILTPHASELDALVGPSDNDFDRVEKASEFAVKHKVIVVLKGAYSATCTKSGRIIFNATGNPGMATAGTGDVLTGVILGLLGRGYRPLLAALIGVFICGYAGDRYAEDYCQESLIAEDIIDYLPKVFKYFKVDGDTSYGIL